MNVKILGSGCNSCKKLAANAAEAATKLGLQIEIEKVTDIGQITAFGVMLTPALVIDGQVVKSGKVLSVEEIMAIYNTSNAPKPATSVPAEPPADAPGDGAPPACCCGSGTCAPGQSGANGIKKTITLILLALVALSVVAMIVRNTRTPTGVATAVSPVATPGVITVYYFHGTQRCATCNTIERLTQETVNQAFARELAEGRMAFLSVNVDDKANEHYITDFALTTRTVVIAQKGRNEHLDEVWTLTGNPEQFKAYIEANIKKMQEKPHAPQEL